MRRPPNDRAGNNSANIASLEYDCSVYSVNISPFQLANTVSGLLNAVWVIRR